MAPTVLEHVYGFLREGSGYTGGKMTSSSYRSGCAMETIPKATRHYILLDIIKIYFINEHAYIRVYLCSNVCIYIHTDGKGRNAYISLYTCRYVSN
jgi:hypothetical protein